jgi:membrane-bound ClpP family serine protease
MRTAVLIVGILGTFAAGALGVLWFLDKNSPEGLLLEAMRNDLLRLGPNAVSELQRWDRHVMAIWFLFGAVPLGLGGAILGMNGRGICGAVLMFLAVLGPAILDWRSLVFTFVLIIAGILCLFVKRPRPILED